MKDRTTTRHYISQRLKQALGEREAGSVARWYLEDKEGLHFPLSEAQQSMVERDVQRLLKGEPLAYVTGVTEFYGMKFEVNPGVLIPRPETEELLRLCLKETEGRKRAVDVGTGSGILPIALKKACPWLEVAAIDVSAQALETARLNARRLGVEVEFSSVDFLDENARSALGRGFDLIISNPPYIERAEAASLPATVLHYEPHEALFADAALQFYEALGHFASEQAESVLLFCEIHEWYGNQVAGLFKDCGAAEADVYKDLQGKDRMVRALF